MNTHSHFMQCLAQTQLCRPGPAQVQWRCAGLAPAATHVLLHGIGSASASWAEQLRAAEGQSAVKVLAWDAPGYGRSAPVEPAAPLARDYGERVWAWLDALQERAPVVLVGHSLGALMAAAAARLQPERVKALVLLAPARGYGDAPEAERAQKLSTRLKTLAELGPRGMADARARAMLSPQATAEQVEAVRYNMAQILPDGYTQAARMLGQGTLVRDLVHLQALGCPTSVACGSLDTITPPASCQSVADSLGLPLIDLGPAGHACPLEAAERVNALLQLTPISARNHP